MVEKSVKRSKKVEKILLEGQNAYNAAKWKNAFIQWFPSAGKM